MAAPGQAAQLAQQTQEHLMKNIMHKKCKNLLLNAHFALIIRNRKRTYKHGGQTNGGYHNLQPAADDGNAF